MKNNLFQIFLAAATIAVALLVLDPWHFWMPNMFAMGLLGALFILVVALAAFVIREKAADEREETHRAAAGRAAFLAGAGILIGGIILQDLAHALDPWLVYALIAMIAAKTITRVCADEWL